MEPDKNPVLPGVAEPREQPAFPAGAGAPAGHRLFVPLVLIVLTLLVMVGFQTVQLNRERDALEARIEALSGPVEEAVQVRHQLDSIARTTARLAAEGNKNAQLIVAQRARQGIKINAQLSVDPAN